jgi:hypothetical protein
MGGRADDLAIVPPDDLDVARIHGGHHTRKEKGVTQLCVYIHGNNDYTS